MFKIFLKVRGDLLNGIRVGRFYADFFLNWSNQLVMFVNYNGRQYWINFCTGKIRRMS